MIELFWLNICNYFYFCDEVFDCVDELLDCVDYG